MDPAYLPPWALTRTFGRIRRSPRSPLTRTALTLKGLHLRTERARKTSRIPHQFDLFVTNHACSLTRLVGAFGND
jgi:uncharacterized protein (DUF2342 family)